MVTTAFRSFSELEMLPNLHIYFWKRKVKTFWGVRQPFCMIGSQVHARHYSGVIIQRERVLGTKSLIELYLQILQDNKLKIALISLFCLACPDSDSKFNSHLLFIISEYVVQFASSNPTEFSRFLCCNVVRLFQRKYEQDRS